METRIKYQPGIPYSLHDMRVEKITCLDHRITFYFENGYIECKEPFRRVEGTLSIENPDYDFCFVYLLGSGSFKSFRGKKMLLKDFIEEYKVFHFEIVDECFGYNSVVYNGYLSLPNKTSFIEITITIYHFGDLVYNVKE